MKRRKKSKREPGFWKGIEEGRSVNFIWNTVFIKTSSANGGMRFQPIPARHLVQSMIKGTVS